MIAANLFFLASLVHLRGGLPYLRAWALCAVEENPEKETEITARLTSSANVSAVAGDLEGVSGPLTAEARSQPITVTIDREL